MSDKEINDLSEQVELIISQLTEVLNEEKYLAYETLLKSYLKVQDILRLNHSIEQIQKEIKWNCRKLMEAPPRNKIIGLKLIEAMDKFHKEVNSNKWK